jgi:hypothetical protein
VPVLVVVAAVDAEHVLEVASADDEDPVAAVGADGADPMLGESVCVWGVNRDRPPRGGGCHRAPLKKTLAWP